MTKLVSNGSIRWEEFDGSGFRPYYLKKWIKLKIGFLRFDFVFLKWFKGVLSWESDVLMCV